MFRTCLHSVRWLSAVMSKGHRLSINYFAQVLLPPHCPHCYPCRTCLQRLHDQIKRVSMPSLPPFLHLSLRCLKLHRCASGWPTEAAPVLALDCHILGTLHPDAASLCSWGPCMKSEHSKQPRRAVGSSLTSREHRAQKQKTRTRTRKTKIRNQRKQFFPFSVMKQEVSNSAELEVWFLRTFWILTQCLWRAEEVHLTATVPFFPLIKANESQTTQYLLNVSLVHSEPSIQPARCQHEKG